MKLFTCSKRFLSLEAENMVISQTTTLNFSLVVLYNFSCDVWKGFAEGNTEYKQNAQES